VLHKWSHILCNLLGLALFLFGICGSGDSFFSLSIIPWDSSKLLHVLVILFLLPSNILWNAHTLVYLTIYPLNDFQSISSFWLLWIKLLQIFVYILYGYRFVFPLDKCPIICICSSMLIF
jgi:hypothetical protein